MDKLKEGNEEFCEGDFAPEFCGALIDEIYRRCMEETLNREVEAGEFKLPDEVKLEFIEILKNFIK